MSGHTPGPWNWHGSELLSPDHFVMCCAKTAGPKAEDARLISAAPDLLAALEDLADVAQVLRPETVGDEMDKEARIAYAQFAIAKASGAAP